MQIVIPNVGVTEWIWIGAAIVLLGLWVAYFVAIVRVAPFPKAVLATLLLPISIPMLLLGSGALLIAIPIMIIPHIPSMLRERRRYAELVAEGHALGQEATEAKLREKEGTFLVVRYAVGFDEVRWTSDVLPGMPVELLREADRDKILDAPDAIARNQAWLAKYVESKSDPAVLVRMDFMKRGFNEEDGLRVVMLFSEGASKVFF